MSEIGIFEFIGIFILFPAFITWVIVAGVCAIGMRHTNQQEKIKIESNH